MENTQTKNKVSKQFLNPAFNYHKYSCESCNYFTNYKNSYNKHIKSAKHLSFVEKEEQPDNNIVKDEVTLDRETECEKLQPQLVIDASMGFINVEEIKKETKTEDVFSYNEYQLNKVVDLMEKLNDKINNNIEMNCIYFGVGLLFNLLLFKLLIGGQWSDFFELSR
jgi:hypothetical protein